MAPVFLSHTLSTPQQILFVPPSKYSQNPAPSLHLPGLSHHYHSPVLLQWPPHWTACFCPWTHVIYFQHGIQRNMVKTFPGTLVLPVLANHQAPHDLPHPLPIFPSSHSSLALSAPATQTTLLFLQHARHGHAPGPLHKLFPSTQNVHPPLTRCKRQPPLSLAGL